MRHTRLAIGVVALAALVALAVLGVFERADGPAGERVSATPGAVSAAVPEPSLGAPGSGPPPRRAPSARGPAREDPASGDTAPANAAGPGAGESGEEELPERILEENARIRRDLEHLARLEAERKRVRRALLRAGATFDGPLRLGPKGLAWPLDGPVVSPFGQRWGRLHAGIDIASPAGTTIRAAADGKVAIAAPTGGYGNYVCVQHTTRLDSCYAHLSRFLTRPGATVRQGQPIGLVGCTGNCFGDHVHFETWVDGQPVDPMGYF